jgi:DME family drug/metabolite transporter
LPRFILASFLAQFVGNACFQFSLGIIGLAASVPITLGVLIVGGAGFGRILLNEPVNRRTMWSMAVIISAVVVLSWPGAVETSAVETSAGKTGSTSPLWLGAMWAIGAGLCYSLFGVITRQALTGGLSVPVTMLVSGTVGVITLTPFAIYRLGLESIGEVTSDQWYVMLAAGFFNFTAFVALTISLKALPVVAVNLINASQVAMAAIAAVILFSEQITPSLIVGIALTFAGLLILAKRVGFRRP